MEPRGSSRHALPVLVATLTGGYNFEGSLSISGGGDISFQRYPSKKELIADWEPLITWKRDRPANPLFPLSPNKRRRKHLVS